MSVLKNELRRYASWFSAIALGWAACSGEPVIASYGMECSDDVECYEGEAYLLGTRCIDNRCVCPVSGDVYCPKKCAVEGDADWMCRPAEECGPACDDATAASSSSSSSSGGNPEAKELCDSPADCPAPPNRRCGTATCVDGVCGLSYKEFGRLDSQTPGDCKTAYCNGAGDVFELEDPGDVYNDGKQCSIDLCENGLPIQKYYGEGGTCPESGSGYCHEAECVQCISALKFAACGGGLDCKDVTCVPPECSNGVPDPPTETDIDCGGPCNPCFTNQKCNTAADCQDGVCSPAGLCAPPAPNDGVKNDGETDVDCGGPKSNAKCADGKGCSAHQDCVSGVCWAGQCQPPTCYDGTPNGGEATADCGGGCEAGCP